MKKPRERKWRPSGSIGSTRLKSQPVKACRIEYRATNPAETPKIKKTFCRIGSSLSRKAKKNRARKTHCFNIKTSEREKEKPNKAERMRAEKKTRVGKRRKEAGNGRGNSKSQSNTQEMRASARAASAAEVQKGEKKTKSYVR